MLDADVVLDANSYYFDKKHFECKNIFKNIPRFYRYFWYWWPDYVSFWMIKFLQKYQKRKVVWNILLDDVFHIVKINTHLNLFISILKFLQKIFSNTDFDNKLKWSYHPVIFLQIV